MDMNLRSRRPTAICLLAIAVAGCRNDGGADDPDAVSTSISSAPERIVEPEAPIVTDRQPADEDSTPPSVQERSGGECTSCALTLERVVALGTADGPGIIERRTTLTTHDNRGRYYVRRENGAEIDVFDAGGTFVTTIGREGAGPGEFLSIGVVEHAEGDTIHVFDSGSLRRSVLSPSYEFVRSNPLDIQPINQAVMLADQSVVLASSVAGQPLHLLDRSGEHIRSFGSATGGYDARVPFAGERVIASAGGDSVWATYRNRYTLELWSSDEGHTSPIRVLERRVPWFPPAGKCRKR